MRLCQCCCSYSVFGIAHILGLGLFLCTAPRDLFPSFRGSQSPRFIVRVEVLLFLTFDHYAHLLILCSPCVRYRALGISLLAPVRVLKDLDNRRRRVVQSRIE